MQDKTIQLEFERLMKEDPQGLLRPEKLVDAAESVNHPLHSRFVWDDTEAARLYRIEQARQVIRSFTVDIPETKVRVRALTSLDVDRITGGYRWTLEVVERPDLRGEMLRTALKELKVVEDKYKHLEELNDVWQSIESKSKEVASTV